MKFSTHIESLYNELPFEERFAAAAADGFKYVEMWDWDNKNLEVVKAKLKENGQVLTAMSGDKRYDMCNHLTAPTLLFIQMSCRHRVLLQIHIRSFLKPQSFARCFAN